MVLLHSTCSETQYPSGFIALLELFACSQITRRIAPEHAVSHIHAWLAEDKNFEFCVWPTASAGRTFSVLFCSFMAAAKSQEDPGAVHDPGGPAQ